MTATSSSKGRDHEMDHYADDLAAATAHLDHKNAIHVQGVNSAPRQP